MKKNLLLILFCFALHYSQQCRAQDVKPDNLPFFNYKLAVEDRITDLIRRLTLEEKVQMMMFNSPEVKRLGIPSYNWWNECLHGVARHGKATVFPQAIGLGATFDNDLAFRVATAISDEARAKYNAALKLDNVGQYGGLTFWTPNVNIFRDPRWGRGQETYGEDPVLTSTIGVSFVKGLQGDNPQFLKVAACAKHFVVHSGPEGLRHSFNAVPPRKDFVETYLPAFESLVKEGQVESVMCAYNRTYDLPCCGSPFLLKDILRKEWNFKGHIVSDCWAIVDFHSGHNVVKTAPEAAAMALRAGVNLNCGSTFYPHLIDAVKQGLVRETEIDSSVRILLRTRFKLGLLDPVANNPYNSISEEVINSPEHQKLAYETAVKSMVLLKNTNHVLPLKKDIKHLYVTGPNASNAEVLLGNYYGTSGNLTTILAGITRKLNPGTRMDYKIGCLLDKENINPIDWVTGDAVIADAVVAVMGISGLLEGEEGESIASPTKGDRFDINLPENQTKFLKNLKRKMGSKPLIVVLTGGSPMAVNEIAEFADAILLAWYPGEQGGNAVGDILFGDAIPSGHLPVTFPRSIDQLPPYENYSMEGRTYRYMTQEPLYPFGFGLSYTQFSFSNLKLSKPKIKKGESIDAEVTVTNAGNIKADEVVQLYLTDMASSVRTPLYALKSFKRINLAPSQSETVKFTITPEMMQMVKDNGEKVIEPGQFKVTIGESSPGKRSLDLGSSAPVEALFEVK